MDTDEWTHYVGETGSLWQETSWNCVSYIYGDRNNGRVTAKYLFGYF